MEIEEMTPCKLFAVNSAELKMSHIQDVVNNSSDLPAQDLPRPFPLSDHSIPYQEGILRIDTLSISVLLYIYFTLSVIRRFP